MIERVNSGVSRWILRWGPSIPVLALALAGMFDVGTINESRGPEIARDILRQNAWDLYKLGSEKK